MFLSVTHKPRVSHLSYTLLFTIISYAVWNSINIGKISKWFLVGGNIDYPGLISFLAFGLSFYIFFFLLFAHRWLIKPLSIVFILLSASASYFISKYDVAIDRTMIMNVIYTDSTEASGLLSLQMIPYLLGLVVLPILLISRLQITFAGRIKYFGHSLLVAVLILATGIASVYLNYDSIHRAGNVSNKYIVHSLTPINYIRSIASAMHRSAQASIRENSEAKVITGKVLSREDLIVVLAIGESARQKSFSLYGYDKVNTNPVLSRDKGLSLLNGQAEIGTTILALRDILQKDDTKLVTITSQLGIDTRCYVNFKLYGNCEAVGEVHVNDCAHDNSCYDEDVIPLLEQDLATYQSGPRFLVLHLGGGSHGPIYSKRHPPEFQVLKPQCFDADVINQCTIEELYNSYDNSILYTDFVLGEIISRLDNSKLPYVFIYVSDHGESLMEKGRIFHGMPPGVSLPPEQAGVPLIVKSSVPITIDPRDEYTHPDLFDTVLDLFNIETDMVEKQGGFIKTSS